MPHVDDYPPKEGQPYVVHFYRRKAKLPKTRISTHYNRSGMSDKEFRLAILREYNSHNRRVLLIRPLRGKT